MNKYRVTIPPQTPIPFGFGKGEYQQGPHVEEVEATRFYAGDGGVITFYDENNRAFLCLASGTWARVEKINE